MSKKIKRIREIIFQDSNLDENFSFNRIEKETITEFDENSCKIREVSTDVNSYKTEWLYKYKFDNNKKITQILRHKNKQILDSEFDFYETKFLYDQFGNKIQIQIGNEITKNLFHNGKIVESSFFIGNHKTSDFTKFKYNENGILLKKETQFIKTFFNEDGTINHEIDISGNDLFGFKLNEEYYNFNFQSFEYDDRKNEISGKGENIPFYSDDEYLDIKYEQRKTVVKWEILYSFDKFENWINKIYLVDNKPSKLTKRQIEYY